MSDTKQKIKAEIERELSALDKVKLLVIKED